MLHTLISFGRQVPYAVRRNDTDSEGMYPSRYWKTANPLEFSDPVVSATVLYMDLEGFSLIWPSHTRVSRRSESRNPPLKSWMSVIFSSPFLFPRKANDWLLEL